MAFLSRRDHVFCKMNDGERGYRRSTIGVALAEALLELEGENEINADDCDQIFKTFDKVMHTVFAENVHPQAPTGTVTGKVLSYNRYQDDWRLIVSGVELVLGGHTLTCPITEILLSPDLCMEQAQEEQAQVRQDEQKRKRPNKKGDAKKKAKRKRTTKNAKKL